MLARRSRFSTLLLSSAVAAAAWVAQPVPLFAQEAPVAPAEAAPAGEKKLVSLAEDFLHYSLVGNDELAKAAGQALITENPDPKVFLTTFEAAANNRDVRGIMIRNGKSEVLKDVSKQLLDRLEEGYRASVRDPKRIEAEIQRLGNGPRAYQNAKERLTAAGQFAAPYYIATLQDSKQKALHPYITQVMAEIGRPLVGPLTEQLQTPDNGEKVLLINILGQIRYPQALPSLKAIAANEKLPDDVRKAASDAIGAIDPRGLEAQTSPADAFLHLAQGYYAKRPSNAPLHPTEATNPVWYFDKGLNNVVSVPVPTAIWGNIETMRAAESALKIQGNMAPAISLWLAADIRSELQLPAGQKDPTRTENSRDAAFYARAAGPIYVNPVLTIALQDRDTGLALKAIEALEATGGIEGLVSAKEGGTPLVKALAYPDRAVRFAAAFALAKANPAKDYPGSFRVVPVLAEAVSQTGTPAAIVAEPDDQIRNRIKAALGSNYTVFEGPSLSVALENARKVAAFDLIVIPAGTEAPRLQELARTDYRLANAPVLVTASKDRLAAVRVQIANYNGYKEIDEADDKALADALSALKSPGSATPIDQTAATNYAITAIGILDTLAGDHASIYKVGEALPALTDALKDKRPEVLTAAATALGKFVNSPDAQKAIAATAIADNAGGGDAKVRIALFNALAGSARNTPNSLDIATINALIKLVSAEQDADVRKAIATALGALNIQSNQAGTLILQQAK